jgi:hypothetical protein
MVSLLLNIKYNCCIFCDQNKYLDDVSARVLVVLINAPRKEAVHAVLNLQHVQRLLQRPALDAEVTANIPPTDVSEHVLQGFRSQQLNCVVRVHTRLIVQFCFHLSLALLLRAWLL